MQTVLRARKVICLDRTRTIGEWVAVEGGRIAGVGRGEAPSAGRTVTTDAVVIPGLIDAHVHLTATGLFGSGLDLTNARSVPRALGAIGRYLSTNDSGWVVGGNFDPGRNPDARMPTRQELDGVSAGKQLLISRADGHSCTVNSAAFEALDLDPALPGIELDDHSRPTGVLRSHARYEAGSKFLAKLPESEVRRAQDAACRMALSRGVTCVHEMSTQERDFDVLIESRSALPISVRPYLSTLDLARVMRAGLDCAGGDLFLDGSLGSHTAALSEPYLDEPSTRGQLYRSNAELTDWVTEASRAGVQIAVHAIGDAAIEQAIVCIEEAFLRLDPPGALAARNLGHRIEHFEMATRAQIERAAALGVVASVQPMFDSYWGGDSGMYAARLGSRALSMNPFSRMLGAGMTVAGGSDSAVTPLDPFLGMAAAVGHHQKDFAVTAEQSLMMFTVWAAAAGRHDAERGSIEPGKRADLALLSDDPLELAPEKIAEIEVLEAWVSGSRAHPS